MFEPIISLIWVTVLLLGSPGPAPLALAAVGASFGVRRGIPFLLGILLGLFGAMLGASFGIAALLTLHPKAQSVMQVLGAAYIVYLALKIATAPVIVDESGHQQAPSFADGFILNLVNPKAYAAFLAIFSQFLLPFEHSLVAFMITGAICMLVATAVDGAWLAVGGTIRPLFTKPTSARLLRVSFGILMIAAVIWALSF